MYDFSYMSADGRRANNKGSMGISFLGFLGAGLFLVVVATVGRCRLAEEEEVEEVEEEVEEEEEEEEETGGGSMGPVSSSEELSSDICNRLVWSGGGVDRSLKCS